jgi:fucose 4-O-acetylase-like acetyltransferase
MSVSTNQHDLPLGYTRRAIHAAQRDLAIDSIRGVAILMVIGIHALSQPLDSALAKAVDAALRPAVPLFLFVSGYLSGRTLRVPVVKRVRATLMPYTIAFAVAYLYMALHNPAMDHRPWVTIARYGLGYVFVYYYVPIYIGCTIILSLLFSRRDKTTDGDNSRLLALLTAAILLGLVVGSYLDPALARLGMSNDFIEEARLRDLPFWFCFMALGAMIAIGNAEDALRRNALILIVCATLGYAIYAATRITSVGDAAAYDSIAYFAYAAPLCALLLVLAPGNAWLAYIGSGSYFIYLWHMFIVMLLRDHSDWQNPALASSLTYAVTVVVSLLALIAVRSILSPRAARWLGA